MGGGGRIRAIGVIATLALLGAPQIGSAQAAPSCPWPSRPRPPCAPCPRAPPCACRRCAATARYRDTFAREFDSLTPENELKMAALQPRRGQYDFAAADELVDYARRNGKAVHGHALVWGLSLPLWLVDHGATDKLGLRLPPIVLPRAAAARSARLVGERDDAADGLAPRRAAGDHAQPHPTVMRHFAGDVAEWDVVNEPMANDGGPAPTRLAALHRPRLRRARAARRPRGRSEGQALHQRVRRRGAGPQARGARPSSCADLQARGVPLDGIGLQTHTHILGFHDEATLASTMRRFAAMGLEVQVTEMDVGTSLLSVAARSIG